MSNSDLLGLERQEKIAQLLGERGRLTVAEISEAFEISEATVRRDLSALAERNMIRRVHGGAMRAQQVATSEAPIMQRLEERAEIKQRIGQAAAQLIQNGETVLLLGGQSEKQIVAASIEQGFARLLQGAGPTTPSRSELEQAIAELSRLLGVVPVSVSVKRAL